MNERIKRLRKELGLTQQAFADRVNLKRNTIATYEMGRNEPMDPIVKTICREFNVSETWLRTGEGPMFVEASRRDQLQAWVDRILTEEPESYKVRLVAALSELDPAGWQALYDLAVRMVEGVRDGSIVPPAPGSEGEPSYDDGDGGDDDEASLDERIEREGDLLRDSYLASRRKKGRSSELCGGDGDTG